MSPVEAFKLILLSVIAIIVLELAAKRLRLPPAAALLMGGAAMAFVPGLPPVTLDPDLVLIVFLPPLLMHGAYFFVWDDFRRNLNGILLLAVGAVAFTTLAVGLVVHAVVPGLPWAACFALGAIVSPPDAVAAKAVLEHLVLPRRLTALLEGESLLNDAAGLVLFRFAIAAALTGAFSFGHAALTFAALSAGGIAIGFVCGFLVIRLLRALDDEYLVITASMLASWVSYVAGDLAGVSGVLSTVVCGMMLGYHQHDVFTASVRMRGTAFWQVVVFLLEALVFVLIGLSLRGVVVRLGGFGAVLDAYGPAVAAVVGAVVVSRFVWVFGIDGLVAAWLRMARLVRPARAEPNVSAASSAADDLPGARPLGWRAATVVSWAGMRGVVTLAIALSLPEAIPGRDLALVAAFAVILVTVLLQGTTIGPLIGALRLLRDARSAHHLTEPQAWARVEAAQLAAIEPLVRGADGELIHPRLYEQYSYRARITAKMQDAEMFPADARTSHYDVVLAAIAAGRVELLKLHRAGQLPDDLLQALEHDLDLQEIGARHSRG